MGRTNRGKPYELCTSTYGSKQRRTVDRGKEWSCRKDGQSCQLSRVQPGRTNLTLFFVLPRGQLPLPPLLSLTISVPLCPSSPWLTVSHHALQGCSRAIWSGIHKPKHLWHILCVSFVFSSNSSLIVIPIIWQTLSTHHSEQHFAKSQGTAEVANQTSCRKTALPAKTNKPPHSPSRMQRMGSTGALRYRK